MVIFPVLIFFLMMTKWLRQHKGFQKEEKIQEQKCFFSFLRLSAQEGKCLIRLILIIRPLHHMLSLEFIMMEGKWSHIRPWFIPWSWPRDCLLHCQGNATYYLNYPGSISCNIGNHYWVDKKQSIAPASMLLKKQLDWNYPSKNRDGRKNTSHWHHIALVGVIIVCFMH